MADENNIDLLQQIVDKCKADVYLAVNNHKSSHQTLSEYLDSMINAEILDEEDIGKKLKQEIIDKDILYELQFYPDTPVGSYSLYHWDLKTILTNALEILKNHENKN